MIPQLEERRPAVRLEDARQIIGELVALLRPACERIEIAGSVRRGKLEVHDAEVVIIPTPDLLPLTDDLIQYGKAQYALYGETEDCGYYCPSCGFGNAGGRPVKRNKS